MPYPLVFNNQRRHRVCTNVLFLLGVLCTIDISAGQQKVHPWNNNGLLFRKSQEETPGIHQMHYLFHLNSPRHSDFHQPSILSDTLYYFCCIVGFLFPLEGVLILGTPKSIKSIDKNNSFLKKKIYI